MVADFHAVLNTHKTPTAVLNTHQIHLWCCMQVLRQAMLLVLVGLSW